MTLSEYLIEAVASRRTGKYTTKYDETYVLDGLRDQLYVNVASTLHGNSEEEVVEEMHKMAKGDAIWADFVDEDSGAMVYFLAGKDDFVAKLVFDEEFLVYGSIYEIKGKRPTLKSESKEDALKYYIHWIDETPW